MVKTDIPHHVLFKKAPGMKFAPGEVQLSFFVTAYHDKGQVRNPWSKVAAFQWQRWGKPLYDQGQPLAAPTGKLRASHIQLGLRWLGRFRLAGVRSQRHPRRGPAVHRQHFSIAQLSRSLVPAESSSRSGTRRGSPLFAAPQVCVVSLAALATKNCCAESQSDQRTGAGGPQ